MTPKTHPPRTVAWTVEGSDIQTVIDQEGFTQWDFGHRVGANQVTVGRWISGKSRIPELVKHILSCPSCYSHFVRAVALRGPEL